MNLDLEEENRIRHYLIGVATPDEKQWVEENLLRDDKFADSLLLIEEELIDDYARGALPEEEFRLFKNNFQLTPQRSRKLMIAEAAVKYATAHANAISAATANATEVINKSENPGGSGQNHQPGRGSTWNRGWRPVLVVGWKVAAGAVLLLGCGLMYWQPWKSESDESGAMIAINRAYSAQRPLEVRITGFGYAPFPRLLGGEEGPIDRVALDRAERILLDKVRGGSDGSALHALGQLYLTRKEFEKAESVLTAALQADPNNPRLHSDLGATLFEIYDRERTTGRSDEGEKSMRQCLDHLSKALALDSTLREAQFNLALLYQSLNQTQMAREAWQKYLALDPDSPWAEEAKSNLKLLK